MKLFLNYKKKTIIKIFNNYFNIKMDSNKKMNCLLCGSKTAKLLEEKYPGYQEPETFHIYYCSSCNTSFSLPRVDTRYIYERIYQNADKVLGYDRYWKYMNTVKRKSDPLRYLMKSEEMYWAVGNALSKITKPKEELKIIEVGCGLGYLTYALTKAGYNTTGLDISQNAIDEAIKNFGNNYVCDNVTDYAVKHEKSYDIVILTEVIEHIEAPVDFLQFLVCLLKEKGQILLTTPNKTIYSTGIVWNTDLPPIHLWWFSEDSMRYIAGKINAEVHFINFSSYYKRKYGCCIINGQKNIQEIKHVFNSEGIVISKRKKGRSFIIIPSFLKRLYSKLNSNRYVYGKRGGVLGVIFNVNFHKDIQ
jgi:2-polyprenyl-3-methyl-5-hydroxy-6-metoxy-1,4-benzoquinol methylase